MKKFLQLDGKAGGGQIMRSALSLSMVTGTPFEIINIRAGRSKPGLMRQHLTCVLAAAEVCDATVSGAEIGSTSICFTPGAIRAGDYHFAIGTAGSTSLLFQTLYPALSMTDAPSSLVLEGGTHNPLAPPTEFLQRAFLPAIAPLGWRGSIDLIRAGFAPAGGGRIDVVIEPHAPFTACDYTNLRASIENETDGEQDRLVRWVHRGRAREQRDMHEAHWTALFGASTIEKVEHTDGPGMGGCLQMEEKNASPPVMIAVMGNHPTPVDHLAKTATKLWRRHVNSLAPVDPHLADQLLLPLALGGGGSFICSRPDDHLSTNIAVIERFLDATFTVIEVERGCVRVDCAV